MSNTDKWNFIYDTTSEIISYGDNETYMRGWKFLKDCKEIEDWGCGFGYFGTFVPKDKYIGIDGSNSKAAAIKADLTTYTSSPSGIFMRHILEHNAEWEKVLKNAIASFKERMVLIIFTPFAEETRQIAWNTLHDVPDLSFKLEDLTQHFNHLEYDLVSDIKTGSQYGIEHIFYISK